MSNDRRVWIIVVVVVLSSAAVSFFSGRIAEAIYPPNFDIFVEGEVEPEGEPTLENFKRLRRGMRRHEVRSILGAPRAAEGLCLEMWWPDDFSIHVFYDEARTAVESASVHFKDGRVLELEK